MSVALDECRHLAIITKQSTIIFNKLHQKAVAAWFCSYAILNSEHFTPSFQFACLTVCSCVRRCVYSSISVRLSVREFFSPLRSSPPCFFPLLPSFPYTELLQLWIPWFNLVVLHLKLYSGPASRTAKEFRVFTTCWVMDWINTGEQKPTQLI